LNRNYYDDPASMRIVTKAQIAEEGRLLAPAQAAAARG
jgi:hypothetical protein